MGRVKEILISNIYCDKITVPRAHVFTNASSVQWKIKNRPTRLEGRLLACM